MFSFAVFENVIFFVGNFKIATAIQQNCNFCNNLLALLLRKFDNFSRHSFVIIVLLLTLLCQSYYITKACISWFFCQKATKMLQNVLVGKRANITFGIAFCFGNARRIGKWQVDQNDVVANFCDVFPRHKNILVLTEQFSLAGHNKPQHVFAVCVKNNVQNFAHFCATTQVDNVLGS